MRKTKEAIVTRVAKCQTVDGWLNRVTACKGPQARLWDVNQHATMQCGTADVYGAWQSVYVEKKLVPQLVPDWSLSLQRYAFSIKVLGFLFCLGMLEYSWFLWATHWS